MTDLAHKQNSLLDRLESYSSCAVAFSGGVDSAVVAKAAFLALGQRALAVTGTSASLAEGELTVAREVASFIGIRHEVIATGELGDEQYTRNAPDRCYHCKTELYSHMVPLLGQLGVAVVVNGANADDAGDYRPGMTAAAEHAVRSPLLECGLTKADVRELATAWELPVADKPASPCLSSRIAYGQEVTPERLQRVDRAEQFLRARGLPELRVRYHADELARIEVPAAAIPQLCAAGVREEILSHFQTLGFRYVTIDLAGFQSGSLNRLLDLEMPSATS